MTPILIGYFPKRTAQKPDWLAAIGVQDICSVSTCISTGPEDWVDLWKHNEMWVYDSPELAWGAVPKLQRHEFDLYAYRMFPVIFKNGSQNPFPLSDSQVTPLTDSFICLGYDMVSRSCDSTFECSPLSCNGRAADVAVNTHCLIDDLSVAFKLARQFDVESPEPGPYHVMEVWRHQSPSCTPPGC